MLETAQREKEKQPSRAPAVPETAPELLPEGTETGLAGKLLGLQKTAGNAAVSSLFEPGRSDKADTVDRSGANRANGGGGQAFLRSSGLGAALGTVAAPLSAPDATTAGESEETLSAAEPATPTAEEPGPAAAAPPTDDGAGAGESPPAEATGSSGGAEPPAAPPPPEQGGPLGAEAGGLDGGQPAAPIEGGVGGLGEALGGAVGGAVGRALGAGAGPTGAGLGSASTAAGTTGDAAPAAGGVVGGEVGAGLAAELEARPGAPTGTAGGGAVAGGAAGAGPQGAAGTAVGGQVGGAVGAALGGGRTEAAAGSGGVGVGGGAEGEVGGGAEEAPPMPEVQQLSAPDELPAQAELPEEAEEGAGPEGADAALEAAANPIEGAQRQVASGLGGVLETIVSAVRSALSGLASSAISTVRTVVTTIKTNVERLIDGAVSLALTAVRAVVASARSVATTVIGAVRTVMQTVKAGVAGAVRAALSRVRSIVATLAGPVRAAISAALRGGNLGQAIVQAMVGRMTALLASLPARILALQARLTLAITSAAQRITELVGRVAAWLVERIVQVQAAIQRAIGWLAGVIRSVLGRVQALTASLPRLVRAAAQFVADRIIGLARAVLGAVERAASAWVARVAARLLAKIMRAQSLITRAITFVQARLITVVARIAGRVLRVMAAVQRFRNWLVSAIRSRVQRVLAAISRRINDAIVMLLLDLIGPQLRAAVQRARLMFPNGLPAPDQLVEAARQAAGQVTAREKRALLAGLLRPEGDHIGVNVSLTASAGKGIGGTGGGSLAVDVVFDYRRNEVGFFATPSMGAQLNIGDAGITGNVGAGRSWGTVGSFGEASQDVLQSWGGWSTGATYGVQGSIAKGIGGGLYSGGTIYRSGSLPLSPGTGISYTPPGAGTRLEPGQPLPPQLVPGTPEGTQALHLGEIRFPTGVGDMSGALPPAAETVDRAVAIVRDYPASARGHVHQVTFTGEASPHWRHPRPGVSPADENERLSVRRAQGVADAIGDRMPVTNKAIVGLGSREAERAGGSRDAPMPERQRVVLTGEARIPATPDTTRPGGVGPPQEVPNQFTIEPSLPNPFTSQRTAWGWDTNVGIAGKGGAQVQAGVYGGITAGYAIPLGKAAFSPFTMSLIRIVVGLYKLINDVLTGSPLAFIRDAVALGVWGVEQVVGESITNAVLDWAVPMPAGAA
ncbi:MAG TPA: hypothetical protein VMP67_06710 [Candidatus Limnocylindria bacterium]|nr:hypothetical protein [Candidatus Limnocylindria bacterium]